MCTLLASKPYIHTHLPSSLSTPPLNEWNPFSSVTSPFFCLIHKNTLKNMAAKLLRTLSDDNNSDMPKPIGCMAGIFHLFGRGHFLSKRRHVTNTPLPAPANNNTISVVPTTNKKPEKGLNNIVKDSILYRDVRGISVRRSSTKQQSPTLTYIDSPRPSLPSPKSTKSKLYGFRESMSPNSRFLHRKDSPRFSYDGRESKPATFKIKELPPRYSLDSKRPTSPPLVSEEHGSHRRQPSIVAKLMGLEDLEEMDHVSEESLYHPISTPEEKKPTVPSRRIELAPWKRPGGTTVYGQIEKRLAQLEFQKSGKDLRALKQILQAMQNCEPKKESETLLDSSPTIIKRIASPKKSKSPTFTVKTTKISESAKKPTSSCVVPVPGLRKLDLVDKKRVEKKQSQPTPEISRSPRQQKANFSKQPESAKKINQSRQAKSKAKAKPKLSYGLGSDNSSSCGEQSNSISVQSDSINSQEEMEVSSAYTRQERKLLQKMASRITEDDFISKSHTPEQPSPVSVLDAITFEDEPPSPVPMINRGFQDVEPLSYNKTPEKTEPKFTSTLDEGYSSLGIMYLSPIKPIQHSKEINSPEDGYISEFLLASGLLSSGKSKYIDEIQKRLVSDVVNELLIENIASDQSIPSVPQQKQLLKSLCSEIDELQCELDEEDDDCFRKMLEKDLGRRSMDWKLGFGDNSGMVLDIERMVFRDLIWEVVSSEAMDLRAGYMKPRRQLFKN